MQPTAHAHVHTTLYISVNAGHFVLKFGVLLDTPLKISVHEHPSPVYLHSVDDERCVMLRDDVEVEQPLALAASALEDRPYRAAATAAGRMSVKLRLLL